MVKKRVAAFPLVTAILAMVLSAGINAQNAATTIGAASKAMGAENLNSITYSGSAGNANFGQSKTIGTPWAPTGITRITTYTRTIDLNQPASRAFGPTMPPTVPGAPAPMPGNLNQNITPAQNNWTQQLEIWSTPWGFLKGAAYHVRGLEHSDGMLVAHLPTERILHTADFGIPNPGAAPAPVNPSLIKLVENLDRLKLDFTSYVMVHPPVPDRDRKSTRLNSSHWITSRMPSSA